MRQIKTAVCLSALHFFFVVCGAFEFTPWSEDSWLGTAIETYGALSGANNAYTFFAPAVPHQTTASVTVSRLGVSDKAMCHFGDRHDELDHRIASMIFWYTRMDALGLLSRSLATYCLNEHRGERADVVLTIHEVPSLRSGETKTNERILHTATYQVRQ